MSRLKRRFPSFLKLFRRLVLAHWQTLLLLFIGVGLPLLIFEHLAVIIWHQGGFAWDRWILLAIHSTSQPMLDRLAKLITPLGVYQGVFPATVAIAILLFRRKRWRSLSYFLITLCGSGLINRTAKVLFHRVRPAFWDVLPEPDFAFPSGHAMSSMSFVAALIILTWGTRWSWIVGTLGIGFVLTIAWTRLYLGVHFPSDILAGWMVSVAWAIGVSLIVRPNPKPNVLKAKPPLDEISLKPKEFRDRG